MSENSEKKSGAKNANRWTLAAVVALVVVVLILQTVWKARSPETPAEAKLVWVQVIHGDGTVKDFDLNTTQEYLGPAMVEAGIVEGRKEPYGLYIHTVDGETADESAEEWWRVTKAGESLSTGADQAPLADGDRYELTFTVGFDNL